MKDTASRHVDADRWLLARFVQAQGPVWQAVCAELAAGAKTSHWMWFVFPQLVQLGRSETARRYGISGAEEAAAYWRHPVLGPRLQQSASLVLGTAGRTSSEIFGSPDDMKLRSCMTLFEAVSMTEPVFTDVLTRFFSGVRDQATLRLLEVPSR